MVEQIRSFQWRPLTFVKIQSLINITRPSFFECFPSPKFLLFYSLLAKSDLPWPPSCPQIFQDCSHFQTFLLILSNAQISLTWKIVFSLGAGSQWFLLSHIFKCPLIFLLCFTPRYSIILSLYSYFLFSYISTKKLPFLE